MKFVYSLSNIGTCSIIYIVFCYIIHMYCEAKSLCEKHINFDKKNIIIETIFDEERGKYVFSGQGNDVF